jgi:hypothetical protein
LQHFSRYSLEQSCFSFRTTSSLAVGEAVEVEVVVGRAEEVAVECRPRQAVRLQWAAEAWGREPQLGRRLAPVGQLGLALARAGREPMSQPAHGLLPAK